MKMWLSDVKSLKNKSFVKYSKPYKLYLHPDENGHKKAKEIQQKTLITRHIGI